MVQKGLDTTGPEVDILILGRCGTGGNSHFCFVRRTRTLTSSCTISAFQNTNNLEFIDSDTWKMRKRILNSSQNYTEMLSVTEIC